jgi:hypothetical protein
MSLMNLLSWSSTVDPPPLRLPSTCLDEIRLTGAERRSADPMIDEDAVADAECMRAVALGGEVLLLCR